MSHLEPRFDLRCGDALEEMRGLDAGSVAAIVTDPPYGAQRVKGCGNAVAPPVARHVGRAISKWLQ